MTPTREEYLRLADELDALAKYRIGKGLIDWERDTCLTSRHRPPLRRVYRAWRGVEADRDGRGPRPRSVQGGHRHPEPLD